ncbi:MAG: hypothetical protein AB7F28_05650 [Candidatus Margulisiibacteriota bacterium]
MEWQDFLTLIREAKPETLRCFSVAVADEVLVKTITELAQKQGGTLVFGFDNRSLHLTGSPYEESHLRNLAQSVLGPHFPLSLQSLIRNERSIIVLSVSKNPAKAAPTPVTTKAPSPIHQPAKPATNPQPITPSSPTAPTPLMATPTTALSSLNGRQRQTLEYLKTHHQIQNKTYRDLFKVSHKTAHIELVDLVDRNLIQTQGAGRSTCYVLTLGF